MILKALIVERLEADGTLKSFSMHPSNDHRNLVVAFARDYQDLRSGPFHFHDEADEKRFAKGFARCRARRLGERKFWSNGGTAHVELSWSGIPTAVYHLSYYALSLPKHAILTRLSIRDPHKPNWEYHRVVTRDDENGRYVIYLSCKSRRGLFDFELTADFKIDARSFSSSNYSDAATDERRGQDTDDWESLLSQREGRKVQQFFISNVEEINMGDNYSAGQAGAMGPQAHAHDMNFHQVSAQRIENLDMRSLAGELATLKSEMRKRATEPQHEIAIGQIAAAEAAAQKGDKGGVIGYLKGAGKWAFDVATQIGVNVASEAIKGSIGA